MFKMSYELQMDEAVDLCCIRMTLLSIRITLRSIRITAEHKEHKDDFADGCV